MCSLGSVNAHLSVSLAIHIVHQTNAFFTKDEPIKLGSTLAIDLAEAFRFGVGGYVGVACCGAIGVRARTRLSLSLSLYLSLSLSLCVRVLMCVRAHM